MTLAGEWQSMLPVGVRVAVSDRPAAGTAEIEALADRHLAGAASSRRAEFVTGRMLAARALAAAGSATTSVGRGARREPLWPSGFHGAITHRPGVVAAVVGSDAVVTGLGIDVEPHDPLPPAVLGAIASRDEQDDMAMLPPGPHWGRILFSAKESVYKAWYPQQRRWLGFLDVTMRLVPSSRPTVGSFVVELPTPLAGAPDRWCRGAYRVVDSLVLTALPLRGPGAHGYVPPAGQRGVAHRAVGVVSSGGSTDSDRRRPQPADPLEENDVERPGVE